MYELRVTETRKYSDEELMKRLMNIILCHFIVAAAQLSLTLVAPLPAQALDEHILWYLAFILSARRFAMFLHDFTYIHSKMFYGVSRALRYESIPYAAVLLTTFDVVLLLYRCLHFFIHSQLYNKDREMITMCAYVPIPALIVFVAHIYTEEKTVYQEIQDPTFELLGETVKLEEEEEEGEEDGP